MKIPSCLSRLGAVLALALPLIPAQSGAEMLKWTTKLAPNFEEVYDTAFGADTYVAVGDNSTILHSVDAVNWSPANLPPGLSCDFKTVAFAFGQFFAGGTCFGSGVLLCSMDGINWTEITSDLLSTAQVKSESFPSLASGRIGSKEYLAAVVKRPGSWGDAVAITVNGSVWRSSGYYKTFHSFFVDQDETLYLLDSDNGGEYWSWLKVGVDSYGSPSLGGWGSANLTGDLRGHAFGNTTLIGVGPRRRLAFYGASNSVSPTYIPSPAITDYSGVAFGRDIFIAVGTNGAIVVSYDLGRSWRRATIANLQSVSFNGIRYIGDRFIAYGGGRIVTGEPINKREWAVADLPSGAKAITSLASNGQRIVAVGKGGQILYSSTGASWSKAMPATSRDLYRVVFDSPTKSFYATGANGTMLRSSNGVSWTTIKTPGSSHYDGVARAGRFLLAAGGARGQFLQSSDGKKWMATKETMINFAGSILGDGSTAYLFGPSGKFLIKRGNSKNWSSVRGASAVLNDLTVANKNIYATAANGRLFSTSQAKPGTWRSVDTRTSQALNGVAANAAAAKQLAAVGEFGLVYSEPKSGRWRLEMIEDGRPSLNDVLKFKNSWIVAGAIGGSAYIGYANEN